MKIALFHNLPSGGAKRHTFEQVRELARRGHQLVEFAPTTADDSFCSFAPFVQQQRFFQFATTQPARRVRFLTPYISALQGIATLERMQRLNAAAAAEIDRGSHDLVFAKDCQLIMNPYVLRQVRTPSVFQCHHGLRHLVERASPAESTGVGARERLKAAYFRPAQVMFERKFANDSCRNIKGASLVLTNSRFSKGLLADHYALESHVIYPGINTAVFTPQRERSERGAYVLSVGALILSKGYRFLVDALGRIPAERRPKLVIAANSVAPDEEQIVRKLATAAGVDLCVETITNDQRLADVYRRARAFVYAPLQEALGMAPLEAMACATPIVAVGEGGVRETVVDGETGWLVERNPDSFARRLDELLSDEPARLRMSDAGVEYVRNNWTWSTAVDNLERAFRKLSDG